MTNRQRAAVAVTGTLVLLSVAGFAPSRSQPNGKKVDAPLKVAELLDSIVQPRFQKDAGVFGMGRVMSVNGHNFVARFKPADEAEVRVLNQANAYDRDYLISFLHMTHVPGKYKHPGDERPGTANPKPYLTPLAVRDVNDVMVGSRVDARTLEKVVLKVLPRLRTGANAQAPFDKWLVVMRPVRALQSSCLSCHTGAKTGDTLGVMVYAVNKAAGGATK